LSPFFFSPVATGEMPEGQRGQPVGPTWRPVLPSTLPIAMGEGTFPWARVRECHGMATVQKEPEAVARPSADRRGGP
jgi:hypothetical protein